MSEEDFLGFFRNEDGLRLDAGQVLFAKGDMAHEAFVVRSGELQIVDGNHVFETIGPGGIVGEMALIDRGQRSATVRAGTPTEVIPLDERRFLFMVQQTPYFALRVLRVMSGRLRAMNAHAVELESQP